MNKKEILRVCNRIVLICVKKADLTGMVRINLETDRLMTTCKYYKCPVNYSNQVLNNCERVRENVTCSMIYICPRRNYYAQVPRFFITHANAEGSPGIHVCKAITMLRKNRILCSCKPGVAHCIFSRVLRMCSPNRLRKNYKSLQSLNYSKTQNSHIHETNRSKVHVESHPSFILTNSETDHHKHTQATSPKVQPHPQPQQQTDTASISSW